LPLLPLYKFYFRIALVFSNPLPRENVRHKSFAKDFVFLPASIAIALREMVRNSRRLPYSDNIHVLGGGGKLLLSNIFKAIDFLLKLMTLIRP
jgi:hypothetical protein